MITIAIMTFLLALVAFAGKGIILIALIIAVVICPMFGTNKSNTTEDSAEACTENTNTYYINYNDRYQLPDMANGKKLIMTSNDYQSLWLIKRKMGTGYMIKDTCKRVSYKTVL